MSRKSKKLNDESRWEQAAALFENPKELAKIAKASRVLTASEERAMLGSSRAKQISIRLPEEDLQAVKEIALATDRPYQQLVVVAIQQYIDRIAHTIKQRR